MNGDGGRSPLEGAVFDEGLQPERTALAWRRTGLALMIGSLLATRIFSDLAGLWSAVCGVAGAVASAVLLVAAHKRFARVSASLIAGGDREPIARGGLVAAVAAGAIIAAGAGVFVTGIAASH